MEVAAREMAVLVGEIQKRRGLHWIIGTGIYKQHYSKDAVLASLSCNAGGENTPLGCMLGKENFKKLHQ